jgi:hypothetical protein
MMKTAPSPALRAEQFGRWAAGYEGEARNAFTTIPDKGWAERRRSEILASRADQANGDLVPRGTWGGGPATGGMWWYQNGAGLVSVAEANDAELVHAPAWTPRILAEWRRRHPREGRGKAWAERLHAAAWSAC